MKKLLVLLLSLTLSMTIISCSSDDTPADSDQAEASENVAEDSADGENVSDDELDSEDKGDEMAEDEGGGDEFAEDEGGGDDEFADDEGGDDEFGDDEGGGDEVASDEGAAESDDLDLDKELDDAATEDAPADDMGGAVAAEEAPMDDMGGDDSFGGGEETAASEPAAEEAPMAEEAPAAEESSMESFDDVGSSSETASAATSEKSWIPVKKIKDVPFERNGRLMNTVYIVRGGDTVSSASQKIYGSDKSDQIIADNPHLSRSFTTGDKLYYNSPNRPGDNSRMITYYEDNGMQPSSYVTQGNENIREVSQKLLGEQGSWKEVWATNTGVESKWALPAGTTLNYWSGSEVASAAPAPAPAEPEMGGDMAMNDAPADIPPPPPAEPALGDTSMNDSMPPAAGTMDVPPPPPPAPPAPDMQAPAEMAQMAPPAPPKRLKRPKKKQKGGNTGIMIGLGVLALGGVVALVMKKKKNTKMTMDIGETQI